MISSLRGKWNVESYFLSESTLLVIAISLIQNEWNALGNSSNSEYMFFPICYGIALEGSVDTAPESSESLAGCAVDI